MIERCYTIAEVASLAKLSRKLVQRAIDKGMLRALSVRVPTEKGSERRITRIPESAINDFLGIKIKPRVSKTEAQARERLAAKHGISLDESEGWG